MSRPRWMVVWLLGLLVILAWRLLPDLRHGDWLGVALTLLFFFPLGALIAALRRRGT